ncbi:MAG: hypothetical protein QM752_03975 [Gammaproteobacteria bacterium]
MLEEKSKAEDVEGPYFNAEDLVPLMPTLRPGDLPYVVAPSETTSVKEELTSVVKLNPYDDNLENIDQEISQFKKYIKEIEKSPSEGVVFIVDYLSTNLSKFLIKPPKKSGYQLPNPNEKKSISETFCFLLKPTLEKMSKEPKSHESLGTLQELKKDPKQTIEALWRKCVNAMTEDTSLGKDSLNPLMRIITWKSNRLTYLVVSALNQTCPDHAGLTEFQKGLLSLGQQRKLVLSANYTRDSCYRVKDFRQFVKSAVPLPVDELQTFAQEKYSAVLQEAKVIPQRVYHSDNLENIDQELTNFRSFIGKIKRSPLQEIKLIASRHLPALLNQVLNSEEERDNNYRKAAIDILLHLLKPILEKISEKPKRRGRESLKILQELKQGPEETVKALLRQRVIEITAMENPLNQLMWAVAFKGNHAISMVTCVLKHVCPDNTTLTKFSKDMESLGPRTKLLIGDYNGRRGDRVIDFKKFVTDVASVGSVKPPVFYREKKRKKQSAKSKFIQPRSKLPKRKRKAESLISNPVVDNFDDKTKELTPQDKVIQNKTKVSGSLLSSVSRKGGAGFFASNFPQALPPPSDGSSHGMSDPVVPIADLESLVNVDLEPREQDKSQDPGLDFFS